MAAIYPADTFQEGVDLTIEASNQLAQVVRGDANTEITVADGSTIPSIRKAQADSMYFKEPELWTTGQTETDYLQLKKYIDLTTNKESWWFAKGAMVSNPIAMGTSPFGDDNWTLYTPEDLFISGKAEYESIYQALKGKAAEAGYNLVRGSFEEGANISGWPDVVWCQADGKYYQWHLDEAKTISAGSTPTNIGTDWIDRTEDQLRTDLDDESINKGADLVKTRIGRSPAVMTRKVSDILLDGGAGLRKNFGAKGDNSTDDTSAFNDWWSCLMDATYKRTAADASEMSFMLQKGPLLLIEDGQFIYNGNGLDIGAGNSFIFNVKGQSALSTKIVLPDDKYLFDLTNNPVHTQLTDLTCYGGRGLIRFKSTSRDVASQHIFERLRLSRYTECGIGNNSIDMPYFKIRDSFFYGDPDSEAIGACVSGLASGGEIARCVFADNRYNIKLAIGDNGSEENGPATPFNITQNDFYRTGNRSGTIHDVWLVPNSSSTNAGRAIVFTRNKWGQENLKTPDTHVLISDEYSTGLTDSLNGDKMHDESTVSTGYVSGLKFTDNNVNSVNAGYTAPFIYSTTPNVGNCKFSDIYDNGMPAKIIAFHPSITQSQIQNLSRSNVFDASQCMALQKGDEPNLLTTLDDVFQVIDPLNYLAGHPQVPVKPAGQQQLNYAHLYSGPTSRIAVASATKASLNNSYGGVTEAAEITLTASDGRAVATVSGGVAGVRHWIDVELKRSSSLPVQSVKIEILDSTGAVLQMRRKVLLGTAGKWQKVRLPYVPNSSGNIIVRFKSDTYVASTNTNFIIGNLNVYINEEPINTGHNSGISMAWNLQHDVKGTRHEWYDASGNKRGKVGAPTSSTDGVIISANAVV